MAAGVRYYPVLLLALLITAPAAAQMADPTRPPPGILLGHESESPVRGPVLQSIIIRPDTRAAIIDGKRVELGDRYGEARVAQIAIDQVVLRYGSRSEVLRMYPDVEMKAARRTAPGTRPPKLERN